MIWNNELYHYGMPRRSGRYKWGSGENPYHHGEDGPRGRMKAAKREYKKTKSKAAKRSYEEAKATYKQTAEYKRSKRRKIIAASLGVTAAATAAYLYANPRIVDDMKKYVSRVGKDKPIGSVPISNKVTVGDKTFVKPVANLTYTGRNTKAQKDARYYRMKKIAPRYSSKGMNIPRYSRPINNNDSNQSKDPFGAARYFANERAKNRDSARKSDPFAAARHFAKTRPRKESSTNTKPTEDIKNINASSKRASVEGAKRRYERDLKRKSERAESERIDREFAAEKSVNLSRRNARTIGYNRPITGRVSRPERYGKIGTKRDYDMEYEGFYDKDIYGTVPNRIKNRRYKGKTRRIR